MLEYEFSFEHAEEDGLGFAVLYCNGKEIERFSTTVQAFCTQAARDVMAAWEVGSDQPLNSDFAAYYDLKKNQIEIVRKEMGLQLN